MKTLIQRVRSASVEVEGQMVGQIAQGLLVFVGFEKTDTWADAEKSLKKLLSMRVFADEQDKMNRSILDIHGDLLVVSQFTLAGSCEKGTRPSFDQAMPPTEAKAFYDQYVETLRTQTTLKVETGQFGAMMAVSIVNDGPVTFLF